MPGQKRFTHRLGRSRTSVLLAWFVFSLFPIVWMVLLALKSRARSRPRTYFPFTPTLENFAHRAVRPGRRDDQRRLQERRSSPASSTAVAR